MDPLVASVIRTLVPVAVGQVSSWLLLLNVALSQDAKTGLGAFLGGLITAIYYVGVRIIEQQWPGVGVLLGLPKSPDTYSKDTPETKSIPGSPALTVLTSADAAAEPAAPASVFPAARVEAALAEPLTVTPVFTPPAN